MENLVSKELIWNACHAAILSRISTAEHALTAASDASQDDTKSSAGDKFETGREMMQQEMNRHGQLLAEAKLLLHALGHISPSSVHTTVQSGSVVHTDKGIFFIGVGIGNVMAGDKRVYAISLSAPIGKLFIGSKPGDLLKFNHTSYHIQEVY